MNVATRRTPRTLVSVVATALVATLLAAAPALLEGEPASAVGPPAGCSLSNNLGPTWSHDSTRVVWRALDSLDGQTKIFVANADGTSRSEISSESADPDPSNNRNPVFDGDSTHIAWDGTITGPGRLPWVAAADGTGRVDLSTVGSATDKPTGNNRHPQFDPSDDTRVTWSGNAGSSGAQIWVGTTSGSSRTEISSVGAAPDPIDNFRPQFSPDGTKVAWEGKAETALTGSIQPVAASTTVTGVGTLFTTELAVGDTLEVNGEQRTVTAISSDTSLTVNNAFVATTNDTTLLRYRSEIFVASSGGGSRMVVSTVSLDPDPSDNRFVQWSHDGAKLVWAGYDGTTERIYTANADGTGRVEISAVTNNTPDPTDNKTPQWSPDDSKIMWVGKDGVTGFDRVFIADADGSNRFDAVAPGGPGSDPDGNTDPQWSPDGTKIAWSGSALHGKQVFVANADGTTRAEISLLDDTTPGGLCNPDTTAPTITLTTPADGTAYNLNQAVTADYACDDDIDPVVPTCTGPVANGAAVDTSTAGVFSFTVTATDSSGNTAMKTVNYSVAMPPPTTTTTTTTSTTSTTTTTSLPGGIPQCPTAATPFTDVPATSFAVDDVKCIYGLGITTGTSATTYDPFSNVTREQMASFLARLWRAVGGTCSTATTPFTDVAAGSFATDDVKCIYALGVTTGTSATTYSPNDFVTREQMASFLARLWRAVGGTCSTATTPFTDVPATSFATDDVKCIYALGVTTGTSATTYSPGDAVTREQMASFLARLYRAIADLV